MNNIYTAIALILIVAAIVNFALMIEAIQRSKYERRKRQRWENFRKSYNPQTAEELEAVKRKYENLL